MGSEKEIEIQAALKKILELRFELKINNDLYDSSSGLEKLIRDRAVGEVFRQTIANEENEPSDSITFISSGLHSNNLSRVMAPVTIQLPREENYLRLLGAAIGCTEQLIINHKKLDPQHIQQFERTRQFDLKLVIQALLNYNSVYIQQSNPYHMPDQLLYNSHKDWPPHHALGLVLPTSAYDIIQACLKTRKKNQIDAVNPEKFIEVWECKRIPNPTYEKN